MFTSMLQKHHHFWLLETQSAADCALPWQPAPTRERDLCSAQHGVVAAPSTRHSCKHQGRSGPQGHHPKCRRGKQLVQREHEELEDCAAWGPHHGLTPGSAARPMLPAHQAWQGQQQRGHVREDAGASRPAPATTHREPPARDEGLLRRREHPTLKRTGQPKAA